MPRKNIEWWTIKARWSDSDEDVYIDVPDWVAENVDEYLTELEDEENNT